jgi:hypothetical protein
VGPNEHENRLRLTNSLESEKSRMSTDNADSGVGIAMAQRDETKGAS